jgi:class 3 adenylate cyclase
MKQPVERRLAAILAADVAGYSRLMGADEEGTLERLKALRRELVDPKIAEHRGRIVKTTGDGVLVEFASVVDAVRCAVEVQQAMPERNTCIAADSRIELRIGINLGDVIVEGDDLYGDGVNIAARIEALADAGGVFVSNTCATGCPLSLRILASSRSRTLPGQCGSIECDLKAPSLTLPRERGREARVARGWGPPSHRSCRSPTSRRSRRCPSPI